MRIGIDCRLPYYTMGGISQYTIYLIQALSKLDTDDEFLIFHSHKDRRSYLPVGDSRFRRVDVRTPSHHRIERVALAAELLPHRLDVFHSPDFIPPAAGASRRVITVHDLNFLYDPDFMTPDGRRYYNKQIHWAVNAADAISADSEATKSDILHMLSVPKSRVKTILLATNPLYAEPTTESEVAATLGKYGLEPGYVLFVGNMEPRKNAFTLFNAIADMRWAGKKVTLALVGSTGWILEPYFEAFGVASQAVHLELVSDLELRSLYHAAGVLAIPSYYEGFGLTALEAMHCGCPVVSSNRASLPEVVGDAGILLEPGDEVAWAGALQNVLEDDALRADLVAKGYQQAARFTWQSTAEQTLALYHSQE